jgi:hypothetical protein
MVDEKELVRRIIKRIEDIYWKAGLVPDGNRPLVELKISMVGDERSVDPAILEKMKPEAVLKLLRQRCHPLERFCKEFDLDYTMLRRMFSKQRKISSKEAELITSVTGISLEKAGIQITSARARGDKRRNNKKKEV